MARVLSAPPGTASPRPTATPTSTPTPTTRPTTTPKPSPSPTTKPPGSGRPGAGNTGVPAGVTLRRHDGELVVTQPGTVIDALDIHGFLKIKASNVTVRRSIVRGGVATNAIGLITTYPGIRNLVIEDSELVPEHPSVWLDGVKGHNFTARRLNVHDTTDGFGVHDITNSNGPANVVIERNWVHDLSYFSPDPTHADNHTHNDGIQIHGNSNIRITGNTISATVSQASGTSAKDGLFPSVTGQAIGLTPVLGPITGVTIEGNWLDYGAQSITIIRGKFGNTTTARIARNIFGRHQPALSKAGVRTSRPILIDAALTIPGLPSTTGPDRTSGNVYEDGTPVVVTRMVNAA